MAFIFNIRNKSRDLRILKWGPFFFFFNIHSVSGNNLWFPTDVIILLEKEGKTETMCEELTSTSIPHPPALTGGRRLRKSGMKLSLGRRNGQKRRCFKMYFYFSLTYTDFNGNKLINKLISSSQVCFASDGECSFPVAISIQETFIKFSLPFQLSDAVMETFWSVTSQVKSPNWFRLWNDYFFVLSKF